VGFKGDRAEWCNSKLACRQLVITNSITNKFTLEFVPSCAKGFRELWVRGGENH